jgi:hypothetical protein
MEPSGLEQVSRGTGEQEREEKSMSLYIMGLRVKVLVVFFRIPRIF